MNNLFSFRATPGLRPRPSHYFLAGALALAGLAAISARAQSGSPYRVLDTARLMGN